MPEVPRIEMPPTMPRREFKVFPASDAPRGTEIVTSIPAGGLWKGTGPLRSASITASRTIALGPGFIAASPIARGSPGG